jgi:hypothetical protein
VLAFRAAQVALRAGDVTAVLDWLADGADGPLAGLADVSRAAVAGHSFGGAAAARAAATEPRLRAAVLLDAWQWPLGAAGPAAGLPVPSLLFESDAFLGDRDAFCAFNSRMSSEMALNSTRAWKVVARVGHYEYTDMALTAPLFMRALGLIMLKPSQLVAFQRYQSAMVRSFLHEFVAAPTSSVLAGCPSVDEGGPCNAPAELPQVPPSPRPAPPPSPGRLSRASSGAPPGAAVTRSAAVDAHLARHGREGGHVAAELRGEAERVVARMRHGDPASRCASMRAMSSARLPETWMPAWWAISRSCAFVIVSIAPGTAASTDSCVTICAPASSSCTGSPFFAHSARWSAAVPLASFWKTAGPSRRMTSCSFRSTRWTSICETRSAGGALRRLRWFVVVFAMRFVSFGWFSR